MNTLLCSQASWGEKGKLRDLKEINLNKGDFLLSSLAHGF